MSDRPTLRRGSPHHDWVSYLQGLLASKGYQPGPVDGLFGPRTHDAVVQYQSDHSLMVDGIVGDQTWASLHDEAQVPPKVSPPGTTGPTGTTTPPGGDGTGALRLDRLDVDAHTVTAHISNAGTVPIPARAINSLFVINNSDTGENITNDREDGVNVIEIAPGEASVVPFATMLPDGSYEAFVHALSDSFGNDQKGTTFQRINGQNVAGAGGETKPPVDGEGALRISTLEVGPTFITAQVTNAGTVPIPAHAVDSLFVVNNTDTNDNPVNDRSDAVNQVEIPPGGTIPAAFGTVLADGNYEAHVHVLSASFGNDQKSVTFHTAGFVNTAGAGQGGGGGETAGAPSHLVLSGQPSFTGDGIHYSVVNAGAGTAAGGSVMDTLQVSNVETNEVVHADSIFIAKEVPNADGYSHTFSLPGLPGGQYVALVIVDANGTSDHGFTNFSVSFPTEVTGEGEGEDENDFSLFDRLGHDGAFDGIRFRER